jgi:capsular exopolysaccharide synthesis family protein
MDLLNYLRVLQRWVWLLIICVIIGAGVAFFISNSQTPIYETSVRFWVTTGNSTYSSGNLTGSELANTYIQMLTTPKVIQEVQNLIGNDIVVNPGNISAENVTGTRFINVTVRDTDPDRAAIIANTMVDVLVAENEAIQNSRFLETETAMKLELESVKSEIERLTSEIDALSSTAIEEKKDEYRGIIAGLQTEINDLEIYVWGNHWKFNPQPGTTPPQVSPQETAEYNSKNNLLNKKYQERDFYQQLLWNLESGNTSYFMTQIQTKQNSLNAYFNNYTQLLTSYQQLRVNNLKDYIALEKVDTAVPPNSPIYPNPRTAAVQGGIFGLVLSAGAVLLMEYLDDTIKTPDDVARIMGMRVIGFIPEVDGEKIQEGELFVTLAPRSPVAEGFRALRTNLEFISEEVPLNKVLVTSSGPGDGKSTVLANLAEVFLQSGKRVLVIDADMRRPTVHKHFSMTNRVGLSDVLTGRLNINAVIQRWGEKELYVVTSGPIPSNPTELLGMPLAKKIIEELSVHFDMILIDSPPFVVADAAVLAAEVDGVIFVVKPGVTHSDSVQAMLEQLRHAKANIVGAVMNKIPKSRGYYYGGYRRYYQRYGAYTDYQ